MFSCKRVGVHRYLVVDLEEQCYRGRHLAFVLALGIPQLFVYVIGLPGMVLYFLRRNYNRERSSEVETDGCVQGLFRNPIMVTRWGLFFKR